MVAVPESTGHAMRRSTRVPAEIGVRVRSLHPGFQFEEQCQTLLVNAQGCGFQSPRELPVGIAISLTIDNRQATATVLNATSLGEGSDAWVIGAKLHQAGNFWGLASPPPDWAQSEPLRNDGSIPAASIDRYVVERVTAEIQRQSEEAMAGLRDQVEKLVAAREAEVLARIVRESSATIGDIARRAADQQSARVQDSFENLSRRFQLELAEHAKRQTVAVEERLRQAQVRLEASGEARFGAITQEIVQKMQQDAKRLSECAIAQWNAAFEQTLKMLPELVREHLQHAGQPESSLLRH